MEIIVRNNNLSLVLPELHLNILKIEIKTLRGTSFKRDRLKTATRVVEGGGGCVDACYSRRQLMKMYDVCLRRDAKWHEYVLGACPLAFLANEWTPPSHFDAAREEGQRPNGISRNSTKMQLSTRPRVALASDSMPAKLRTIRCIVRFFFHHGFA